MTLTMDGRPMQNQPVPPPPYTSVGNTVPAAEKPVQIPQTSSILFPTQFGLYGTSFSDLYLALHKDANPIFYVSTHGGLSSKPDVVLHSTANKASPALATANFHAFSSKIDCNLNLATPAPSPYNVASGRSVALERDGMFTIVHYFDLPMASTGRNERFEWKHSSGPEVQSLDGRSKGLKLVMASTGEIVAAWASVMSMSKKGKMQFMGNGIAGMGAEFQLMTVISVLAIMVKASRSKKNGAAAGGAGGGGGGGC